MSKAISYVRKPSKTVADHDPRIKYINSYLPEQRVIGFSHQAVHISPANPHYGVSGEYRNCGINSGRSMDEAEECLSSNELWFTEVVGGSSLNLPPDVVTARLTFNPLFQQLFEEIDDFLFRLDDANNRFLITSYDWTTRPSHSVNLHRTVKVQEFIKFLKVT